MGTLKPGATYIYEQSGGVTYAREAGAPSHTRKPIGWTLNANPDVLMEDQLWGDIRKAADTNPALHAALERVKVIYYMSKDNGHSKT